MENFNDLTPVDRAEFAEALTPCLSLVGGIGMASDERRTWLNAAFKALDGIPIALLKRGAQAALMRADHPSKIVPIITAEIGEAWDRRRRSAQWQPPQPSLPPPAKEICTPEDAAEILRERWPTMHEHEPGYRAGKLNLNPDRECRKPTRADYISVFGMTEAQCDAAGIV